MKLCNEGDIYFIPKFHILETRTVELSTETDLIRIHLSSSPPTISGVKQTSTEPATYETRSLVQATRQHDWQWLGSTVAPDHSAQKSGAP
jgi:hypothetical protein